MALERTRWWERDPRLFYLALTLTDTNPGQEGLTSKTLTLDPGVRVGEYVSCGQWFQTRFLLRMKRGTSVRVYISVLMLEVDHVTLMLRFVYDDNNECVPCRCLCFSKESTCNEVVSVILRKYRFLSAKYFERKNSKDLFLANQKTARNIVSLRKCYKRNILESLRRKKS